MSNLTELRQRAREYSGSYRIIEDARGKIKDKPVFYIRHQNPNNLTNNEYVEFRYDGREGSLVTKSGSDTIREIAYELGLL